MTSRRAAAGLALLSLAACDGGGAGSAGAARMTVDTAGGVVHILHEGAAPVRDVAEELVLGRAASLDEEAPDEFGRVGTVIADGDGNVYVADRHARQILVFDADGGFLRRLGRPGSGPGEIGGMHGALWLSDDTLVVVDHGNARLTLLTRDGEYAGQWPWLPMTGGIRFLFQTGPDEVHVHGIRRTPGPDGRLPSVWVRYSPDGPSDTLAIPSLDSPPSGTSATCRGDGIGFFSNPWGDRQIAVPGPDGERVVAMAAAYRLAFLDAAGDTVRTLARAVEPAPLTDAEWRETGEQYEEFRTAWRGAECSGSIERPPHKPVLWDIGFDHEGRLLVDAETAAGRALDVYDRDGRFVASIPIPDRDRSVAPFLRDGRVYTVTADSLGVQRVRGYRVR